MKATIIAGCVVLSVLATASGAHAGFYTYMCEVGHKTYPVMVTTPNEENGSMNGGIITWRGMTFQNVQLGEGCRYNFVATHNGITAELCTATKGVADLKIGKDIFDCQMEPEY